MSDYKIGYRKPPKAGQIRKGEVRNPYGRAGKKPMSESVTSLVALLEHIDGETVVIDGRAMTRREANVRAQYMSALKGRVSAIRFIDRLSQRGVAEGGGGGVLMLPCDNLLEWDSKTAFASLSARQQRERRNARRRDRRRDAKVSPEQDLPLEPDWKILADLESQAVQQNGRAMSMREVRLRLYRGYAGKGNRAAQAVLERIQDLPKETGKRQPGYLVVPAAVPLEEWEAATLQQQAKYREALSEEEPDEK